MTLRPYQLAAVDAIWQNINRHCYASLPTGSGKSHVLAELCVRALQFEGTRIVVLCPSKELIQQNAEKIRAVLPWTDVSVYCAGLREKRIGVVTVASVQSLFNVKHLLPSIDLIIVDEAHLIPHDDIGRYRGIFAAQPDARVIGLTATPYRMRGGLLHEGKDALFDRLVYECKTSDLIKDGYLSPIRARAGHDVADTSRLHIRAGEFITSEMTQAFDRADLTGKAVKDILDNAQGRKSIMVFCCSVAHCDHVETAFKRYGETSVAVLTGDTGSQERAAMIERFKAGQLRVLINCQVLTTGFDAPNVDCVALLRATASPGLYVQIVGRGLRTCEGKADCLLLDYGGNVERHGPLDSITADRIEAGTGAAPTKTCPTCESIIAAGFGVCPHCGQIFQMEQRELPELATKASTRDPIKGTVISEYDVLDVTYYFHQKPGGKPSMRVEYRVGIGSWVKEWICPEHGGYAAEKASAWFARRGVIMPKTVNHALDITQSYAVPKKIRVKNDGKYNEVIGYGF